MEVDGWSVHRLLGRPELQKYRTRIWSPKLNGIFRGNSSGIYDLEPTTLKILVGLDHVLRIPRLHLVVCSKFLMLLRCLHSIQ